MERLPYWVGIFFVAIVGWRAWIAWAAMPLPVAPADRRDHARRELRHVPAVRAHHRARGGRDAAHRDGGVEAARDAHAREVVLSDLPGLLPGDHQLPLLADRSRWALYMLACVWIFIGTLVGFNRVGRTPTLQERLRPAGALLLQALPLMAGVLHPLPARARAAVGAAAGRAQPAPRACRRPMTPGQHRRADQVRRHRLPRAVRGRAPALPAALLARAGDLGLRRRAPGAWRRVHPERAAATTPARAIPTRYVVTMEPHNKNWLFALDVPAAVPRQRLLRLVDLQLRSRRPGRRAHALRDDLLARLPLRRERAGRCRSSARSRFDETRNPRTIALGRQWARENPDPRAILDRAHPPLQPRVHLHARAAAARPARSLRRFPVRLQARVLRALRGQLRAAHARRRASPRAS